MSMQAMARWLGGAKKEAPLLALLGATLAALLMLGVVASEASAATFSSTDGPITINDGSGFCNLGEEAAAPGTATPYPSVIPVRGLTGSVTDVNVTVSGLSHRFPDDIGLLLVSPEGQSVILMADSGGSNTAEGVTLTFDDAASGGLPDSDPLTSGTYLPSRGGFSAGCAASFPAPAPASGYGLSLSAFDGTNPNGTWQLYVIDDTLDYAGSITGWSLDISTGPTVPTTKADCKKGKWEDLGWPDQGTCITAFNENRP